MKYQYSLDAVDWKSSLCLRPQLWTWWHMRKEMGEHKLRILREMIKGRGWQSPKYKNQFLKPQWTLASTCLCLYLLWNSSKFCAISIINQLIMNGHLLFPSSVKSLQQLRHTSDLHRLPVHEGFWLSPALWLQYFLSYLVGSNSFLGRCTSCYLGLLFIYFFAIIWLFYIAHYPKYMEAYGVQMIVLYLFFSCFFLPIPTSPPPLSLSQCVRPGDPHYTFVVL